MVIINKCLWITWFKPKHIYSESQYTFTAINQTRRQDLTFIPNLHEV
jgi:hypothetical protein